MDLALRFIFLTVNQIREMFDETGASFCKEPVRRVKTTEFFSLRREGGGVSKYASLWF